MGSGACQRAVVVELCQVLLLAAGCLLQTTSEKAIRKELQKHFKADISEKKQVVKEHVSCRGRQCGALGSS
jgi:hypothetical protein